MKRYRRLLIALAVLLSGTALIPYIGLSSEPFGWERYAQVYEPPVEVEIQDFAFVPDFIIVPVGTTVRWTNVGAVDHTVRSDDTLFDSGTLGPGMSFEHTFDSAGRFDYFCTIHPSLMTGTVLVVDEVFNLYLPIVLR